jgi:hypothetical protein
MPFKLLLHKPKSYSDPLGTSESCLKHDSFFSLTVIAKWVTLDVQEFVSLEVTINSYAHLPEVFQLGILTKTMPTGYM